MLIVEIYRRLLNLIPASSSPHSAATVSTLPPSLPHALLLPLSFAPPLAPFPLATALAHTRECDCTCNRISMTVPASDLTTCHPLYQFTAAGDLGFTHVNCAHPLCTYSFYPPRALCIGLSNDSVLVLTAERLPGTLLNPIIWNRSYRVEFLWMCVCNPYADFLMSFSRDFVLEE